MSHLLRLEEPLLQRSFHCGFLRLVTVSRAISGLAGKLREAFTRERRNLEPSGCLGASFRFKRLFLQSFPSMIN